MLPLVKQMRALKPLLRSGVLLFAAGALLDLAAHLWLALGAVLLGGVTFETAAHVLTFVGMAVLLLGVLSTARRRPVRAPAPRRPQERRPPA